MALVHQKLCDGSMKKKIQKKTAWKSTVIWTTAIVAAAIGFGVYHYKTAGWDFSALSESVGRVKNWIAAHKNKPHDPRPKVSNKLVAEQPLHFEFYTALPTMQLATPETPSIEAKPEAVVVKAPPKIISKVEPKNVIITTNTAIVTADEIERELSKHLQAAPAGKEEFAVQVGVFKSIVAAKHYQETVSQAGFKSSVATLVAGKKNLYRVQLGPFGEKNKATLLKHELAAKGINGVIYKINR